TNWWRRWKGARSARFGKRGRDGRFRPGVEILETRTLLSFAAPAALNLPGMPTSVATAHFQGTHAPPDVVTADANGDLSVLLANADGSLSAPINLRIGGSFVGVATADLRGSGLDDIVAANSNGTVSVVLSNGDGTFQNPHTLAVSATPVG